MGDYLNPGTASFEESLHSELYVDKSLLIAVTNSKVKTSQKYLCVSRPRRFGKSVAANMLAAYYSCDINSAELFDTLKIAENPFYLDFRNQYNVIKVNMQEFLSLSSSAENLIDLLQAELIRELQEKYSVRTDNLIWAMKDAYKQSNRSFVILIDEWDCLFREYRDDEKAQQAYLDFLRLWLKDQPYVGLAYMTGILPIKKYGTHSALNMFWEYTMTEPGEFAEFFGFTDEEVRGLCERFRMDYEETRAWYDGYRLVTHSMKGDRLYSMYSPKSITEAMSRHNFGPYWNQT